MIQLNILIFLYLYLFFYKILNLYIISSFVQSCVLKMCTQNYSKYVGQLVPLAMGNWAHSARALTSLKFEPVQGQFVQFETWSQNAVQRLPKSKLFKPKHLMAMGWAWAFLNSASPKLGPILNGSQTGLIQAYPTPNILGSTLPGRIYSPTCFCIVRTYGKQPNGSQSLRPKTLVV